MRKQAFGKQLGRNTNSRKALFRALGREMISHGAIVTTRTKAKAVQPELERLAMLVKEGSLHSRRKALSILGNDRATTDSLFERYKKSVSTRLSGHTRIVNMPARRGDNTQMARIEWVDMPEETAKKVKPKNE